MPDVMLRYTTEHISRYRSPTVGSNLWKHALECFYIPNNTPPGRIDGQASMVIFTRLTRNNKGLWQPKQSGKVETHVAALCLLDVRFGAWTGYCGAAVSISAAATAA